MEEIKLTPRQWHLYAFIKERSEIGRKTDYDDLRENLLINSDYERMLMHGDFDRTVRKDIETINRAYTSIQKPIINDGDGYYIPSSNRKYEEWSKRSWRKLKKMIMELSEKDKKMGLDGQYRLIFDEDSKERDFIESIVIERETKI